MLRDGTHTRVTLYKSRWERWGQEMQPWGVRITGYVYNPADQSLPSNLYFKRLFWE